MQTTGRTERPGLGNVHFEFRNAGTFLPGMVPVFYPKSDHISRIGEWIYLNITSDFLELIPQQIHS
jgi:hypothetical protein